MCVCVRVSVMSGLIRNKRVPADIHGQTKIFLNAIRVSQISPKDLYLYLSSNS